MVGTVARDDLVAAGERARHLDGVLVGLGAAIGEEAHLQVAGRHLGQQPAQRAARLVGEARRDVAQLGGLLLDRRDYAGVLVAQVAVDELRGEIEVALAGVVPEVASLGPRDGQRVDL